jgi:hypothetical protein
MGQIHSDDQASIRLIDIDSREVVFAYPVNKKNTLHGKHGKRPHHTITASSAPPPR